MICAISSYDRPSSSRSVIAVRSSSGNAAIASFTVCAMQSAFFAPVAFRIRSYGLTLDQAVAAEYAAFLLNLESMREWYADALKEKFRDQPHEDEMLQMGSVLQDLRER